MSLPANAMKLTPSEAGFVLGRSPTAINKAVDEGIIESKVVRKGALTSRVLGAAELRYLKLADSLRKDFTPAGRRRIYTALRGLKSTATTVEFGPIHLDLLPVDRDLESRLKRLEAIKASVDGHGLGEPFIRGTKIPVYVIAGLSRGQTIAEIAEDYPSLSKAQIEAAIEYGKAYPKRGRPYPARSLKRMLGDLALQDLLLERTAEGPRRMTS